MLRTTEVPADTSERFQAVPTARAPRAPPGETRQRDSAHTGRLAERTAGRYRLAGGCAPRTPALPVIRGGAPRSGENPPVFSNVPNTPSENHGIRKIEDWRKAPGEGLDGKIGGGLASSRVPPAPWRWRGPPAPGVSPQPI